MSEDLTIPLDPLLKKEGVQFLQHAYDSLFRRTLDPNGQRTYCGAMRAGFSKTHILYNMVNSPEGKSLGVSVPGLTIRYWVERMLPPPFVRRILGFPVPDSSAALLFADLDALHSQVYSLETSYHRIEEEVKCLTGTSGASVRLDEGITRVLAQILHNSGESTRIAYELERRLAQSPDRHQVETVTPGQALDLAHMLRASIAKLERTLDQTASGPEAAMEPGGQYTTPNGLTEDAPSQRIEALGNDVLKLGARP